MKGEEEAAWLTQFLQGQPQINAVHVQDGLRISAGSWVFSAQVNGMPVVIKRFVQDDPAHTVNRLVDELAYLETAFKTPQHQANRCLMHWPDKGVVVLSFAQGARLDKVILAARGTDRAALFQQSGEWLRQYCATRKREATFGPRFWIKKLEGVLVDPVLNPADHDLMTALLNSLRGRIDQVRGAPLIQAATHGDFVGMNMHIHNGVLCGVDIQGESWLPLARDAARFLVWSQMHDESRPAFRRYGIATEDFAAFVSSDVLEEREITTTLPFFIGEQLYLRFVENCHRRSLHANMQAAIEAYLTSD